MGQSLFAAWSEIVPEEQLIRWYGKISACVTVEERRFSAASDVLWYGLQPLCDTPRGPRGL